MAEPCADPRLRVHSCTHLRFTAAVRSCLLALAMMLSGPVLAAGSACPQPADSSEKEALDELAEVVVIGETVRTGTRDLQAWLRLLVGRFSYGGYVDLCGSGKGTDLRPVTGSANCVGAGSTPNVLCTVNVSWAETGGAGGEPVLGGVSSLLPAFVVYTLENRYIPEKKLDRLGLMFTQVDNQGVVEWASGTLVGDTFTSIEPCVGIPGACEKVTRITARPDSNEISMQVVISIDYRPVLRQSFLLYRESNVVKGARSTGSPP